MAAAVICELFGRVLIAHENENIPRCPPHVRVRLSGEIFHLFDSHRLSGHQPPEMSSRGK